MYKTFYSANSNYFASGVVHVSRRTQDEKTNKKNFPSYSGHISFKIISKICPFEFNKYFLDSYTSPGTVLCSGIKARYDESFSLLGLGKKLGFFEKF